MTKSTQHPVLFNNESECCGCSACVCICPKNAISMRPNSLGFLYPEINPEECIGCGLCEQVCAFKKRLT